MCGWDSDIAQNAVTTCMVQRCVTSATLFVHTTMLVLPTWGAPLNGEELLLPAEGTTA